MLQRYAGRKSLLASILHLTVVVLCASNFKPVLFILPHALHKWFQLVRQYCKRLRNKDINYISKPQNTQVKQ
jgi:hypothetical protein